MKYTKMILALPVIGFSFAANAAIVTDGSNVSYTGAKDSTITISADGSVLVNGELAHKCDGTENSKATKAKLATVTCDADFIKVRDKSGNELSRFSGYARATDGKSEERKLLDDSVAQIGSAATGAAAVSQTEAIVTEHVIEKTVTTTPASALIEPPKPADVNQKNYTPKLGTTAQRTPAITKKNSIADSKADAEVREAEKAARAYGEEKKKVGNEVIVTTTEAPADVKETTVITTTAHPTPGTEAPAETTVITTETVAPTETAPAQ